MIMDCSPILALLALCTPAPEGPPLALSLAPEKPAITCMTKEQARATYKTSHLYWHTARHCWDDRSTAPRAIARLPKAYSNPNKLSAYADASGNDVAPLPPMPSLPSDANVEIYYPSLMRKQAEISTDLYAMQKPITQWPLMLDLDITGPDPDHGIDGCCWPSLESLR